MCSEACAGSVSESVAVSLEIDGGGVMEEAIQERGCEHGIGKDVIPGTVALVAGQDHGLEGLVAFADELEEEGGVGDLRVKAPNQAAADFTDRNQAVSFTLHGFAAE